MYRRMACLATPIPLQHNGESHCTKESEIGTGLGNLQLLNNSFCVLESGFLKLGINALN